ncbi:MAG: sodium-dependent transporter [Halobacteria archaeon]
MEKWSSNIGFLFAAIGSAVGLGNIWRFPISVYENGGGAYLIPYLLITFLFGLPVMIVSISGGELTESDVVTTFKEIGTGQLGWVIVAAGAAILSFYLVVTGWILAFMAYFAFDLSFTFQRLTDGYIPVGLFLLSAVIVGGIVLFGIERGIERVSSILVPVLFVVLVGLLIYVSMQPGFMRGVRYFLNPDFSVLSDTELWIAAFGQAFFSLSLGAGTYITYGSYLEGKSSISKMSIIITVANIVSAIIVGLAIFPLVFKYLGNPSNLPSGQELAFTTLPHVFAEMPFGNLFGFVFFGLLLIAALSSGISILEVSVASGMGRGLSRKKSALIFGSLVTAIGLPSALSYSGANLTLGGKRIMDIVNQDIGNLLLPLSALIIGIGLTWVIDEKVTDFSFAYLVTKYLFPVILISTIIAKYI